MLRVLLHVVLLAALFAGAVLYAGNAIGAWEPPNVPVRTTETPEKTKSKKGKKGERAAKREKKR
jgi:hypothetical protein